MNDRIVTAGGALLALLLVLSFFSPRVQKPDSVTRPTSTETGRDGYAAMVQWLHDGGIAVASLRERYQHLVAAGTPYAATGNILVTTMPYVLPTRPDERRALRGWLRQGNTLLVMAAVDDAPAWARAANQRQFRDQLVQMTGLAAAPKDVGAPASAAAPKATSPAADGGSARHAHKAAAQFLPVAPSALFAGIKSLQVMPDADHAPLRLQPGHAVMSGLVVTLAVAGDTGAGAVWQRVVGRGQVVVVASGNLLTNGRVSVSGGGPLLANLVRHDLGERGTVIFDDLHQGLSALYDPRAFFSDPRLHATLWFLIVAWLIYIVGSNNRFAPPRPTQDAPSHGDYVAAIGGFMARRLGKVETGHLMFREWFDELRERGALAADNTDPWPTLHAMPTLDPAVYRALKRAEERLDRGHAVELPGLHNLLNQARKAIG